MENETMPVSQHTESGPDLQLERDETLASDAAGRGEMIVALATIGTLLLTVWILVALGFLEGGAAPSLPDELEVYEQSVEPAAEDDS